MLLPLLPGAMLTMHFYCKPQGRVSRFFFPLPDTHAGLFTAIAVAVVVGIALAVALVAMMV